MPLWTCLWSSSQKQSVHYFYYIFCTGRKEIYEFTTWPPETRGFRVIGKTFRRNVHFNRYSFIQRWNIWWTCVGNDVSRIWGHKLSCSCQSPNPTVSESERRPTIIICNILCKVLCCSTGGKHVSFQFNSAMPYQTRTNVIL